MKTGVIVMNFGEPADATLEGVVPFLERIFNQNNGLHGDEEEARKKRSRELAEARAPGLLAEYEAIGGSPLNRQADEQAAALQRTLRERGHDSHVYSAFQYTSPFIDAAVSQARSDGVERVVGLPVYPLCGHSTNVLALREMRAAVEDTRGWNPEILEIGGWHRHPDFLPMWADHVRAFVERRDVDLADGRTAFLYSIHGTPIRYLEAGSRYDRYVDEACDGIAKLLGIRRFWMGYQNHTNRPITWTQPDVEKVVEELGGVADRTVVVPVAFMHEQSETLAELDHELREEAEAVGLEYHRVPVPHDDPRFVALLADLVESRMGETPAGRDVEWRRCLCRGESGKARCTNGMRLSGAVEVE